MEQRMITTLAENLSRFARAGQRIVVVIQFSHGFTEARHGW